MDAAKTILEDYQIGEGAHIIASSYEIKDDGKNPPCYQAMKQYKKYLKKKENFRCVATENVNKKGVAQPLVYTIGQHGKTLKTMSVGATEKAISNPAPRAGA